jgi:hypothetical protein
VASRGERRPPGKPFVTDGPFAETKELIASKHPVAEFGAIDVRAFWTSD